MIVVAIVIVIAIVVVVAIIVYRSLVVIGRLHAQRAKAYKYIIYRLQFYQRLFFSLTVVVLI